MKTTYRIFFIAVIVVFLFRTANSQDRHTNGYKPFCQFHTDTVKYLTYNFVYRINTYKGQTLNLLLKDLELQTNSFIPDVANRSQPMLNGLIFDFEAADVKTSFMKGRWITLSVYFETPIPYKYMLSQPFEGPGSDSKWTLAHASYFSKFIIKDIVVLPLLSRCDPTQSNYDPVECIKSKCNSHSPDFNKIVCAQSICDSSSLNYDKVACKQSVCDRTSPNYNKKACELCQCIPDFPQQ